MNNLNIKLKNSYIFKTEVFLDDKKVKFKKNEYGNLVYNLNTNKNEVELKIRTIPFEFDCKYWFLLYLFYYTISVFGIFDIFYSKNYFSLNYVGVIKLKENTKIDLSYNKLEDKSKALISNTEDFDDNESNIYIYKPYLKKRMKIINIFKFSSWFILAIILATLIIIK